VTAPEHHIFGVFAPRMMPGALARIHAAMARAFAPDWPGEDVAGRGFHISARRSPGTPDPGAIARIPGAIAVGVAALARHPGGAPLPALGAAIAAAPDRDALGAGPLAGFEGRFAVALVRPDHPGAGPNGAPGPRLDLARDPLGQTPLWTARGPDGEILFATRPQVLLAAPGVSRSPDPVSLALLLTFRDAGPGHGAYADLAEAPRGHRLVVDAMGLRTLVLRRAGPDPALAGLTPADALAALAGRVRAAIVSRADLAAADGLAAGLQFSGGLDSALIAGVLLQAGRDVPAFAAVPSAPDDPMGERAARDAMARHHPGLTITEVPPDGADFLAGAAHYLVRGAMPCPDPMAFNALHLSRVMADAGISAAFSGMGGDFCLSSHGAPRLGEVLRAHGPGAAIAEIARRRSNGGRLRNILIGDIIKPLKGFEAWRRLRPAAADPMLSPGALTPAFAARMHVQGRTWHDRHFASVAAEDLAWITALPSWTVQDMTPLPGGGAMRRVTPLLDADLIDAALAMPVDLRLHRGLRRGLIRHLLVGLAPAEIVLRPDKAPFQPDYARLQAEVIPTIRAQSRAFRDDPVWKDVINAPVWDAALSAAERATPLQGLELSNAVMLPYFLGWWLLRAGDS